MSSRFESIVHRAGICEKNFILLSEIIENELKRNKIYSALEQLERCASERERNMNYFKRIERNNKEKINSQHQWVIDRVRALMDKIRIGVDIGLTPHEWSTIEIKYKTNYFTVKFIPENSQEYFEIKKTTTSKPRPPSLKPPSPKTPSPNVKNNKPHITKSMKRRLKKKAKNTKKLNVS